MRKTPLQIFALAAVLSAVSAVSFSATAAPDETLRELVGYRQWASVRGEPGRISLVPDGVSFNPGDIAV
ncbi:MAG TPA: hypothetical protein VGP08_19400 [Pyrinomonadaceae bacterium]|jgi:hypothetical protein|nr:hypothetical protein [Pyrinomonadaceae bacterium]